MDCKKKYAEEACSGKDGYTNNDGFSNMVEQYGASSIDPSYAISIADINKIIFKGFMSSFYYF
jgi:hypothetical protein